MEHDLYRSQKRVWNMLKNHKKSINEFVNINIITVEQWKDHFKKLYEAIAEEQLVQSLLAEEEVRDESWTITKERIRATMYKLKNRKSPGRDQE